MSTRRKGKFKHDRDDVKAKVAAIPFSKRRRTRMLTAQLEMPQSSLMHTLKEKGSVFKQHSNAIKLKLTEENQQARLQFELLKINLNTTTPTRRGPPQPKFNTLFDEVLSMRSGSISVTAARTASLSVERSHPKGMLATSLM